jgi:hypothetical protein
MAYDWQQWFSAAAAEWTSLAERVAALESRIQQLSDENQSLRAELTKIPPAPPASTEVTPPPMTVVAEIPPSPPHAPPPAPIIPLFREAATGLREYLTPEPPPRLYPVGDGRDFDQPGMQQEVPRRPFVRWLPTTDEELPMIEDRCRLKTAACRWAEQRRRLLSQAIDYRTEVEPKDRDLIWQAKQLPDCFLWMCHSTGPNPADPAQWLMLAGCFEVLGEAIALIRKLLEDADEASEQFEQAVDLLAEAQSALRVAVSRLEGPPTDHDQARVFGWLKHIAMQRQIFIRRFMRLDDPADPARWSELATRLNEFQSHWDEGRRKVLHRKKSLGRIRYKLTQLHALSPQDVVHAWASIADDVDELVRNGLPPSNLELRDLLTEHVDQLPELASTPKGFQLTIREIDRYLASSPVRTEEEDDADAAPDQLDDVAAMLAGRAVILIGGDRRPHAAEALERAFQLSELIWIDTRAHESISGFEPYVARPEVAMVLLAIRWSSHSYGEVQDFCRQYGKPLVRLPGGYNPRQVAAQILQQGSQRLVPQ